MVNYADGRISRKHLNNSKLKERLTCHQNLPTLIYDTRPTCKNIVTLPRCLMHKNNNNMSQQPASQPASSQRLVLDGWVPPGPCIVRKLCLRVVALNRKQEWMKDLSQCNDDEGKIYDRTRKALTINSVHQYWAELHYKYKQGSIVGRQLLNAGFIVMWHYYYLQRMLREVWNRFSTPSNGDFGYQNFSFERNGRDNRRFSHSLPGTIQFN